MSALLKMAPRTASDGPLTAFGVPDAKTLAGVFKLSQTEAKCLQALLALEWASRDDLPPVSYSIRQAIYTLRRKLQIFSGVYIVNDGAGKYSISNIGKAILYRAIERSLTLVE